MSYIPSELVTLAIKFKEQRATFHQFMSRVEDECKTVDKSENDKKKWDIAISLRGFLDTILDSSKLNLSAEQQKRAQKQRDILNKAVLESKVLNFWMNIVGKTMCKSVWMVLGYSLQNGYSPLIENHTEDEALKLAQKENASIQSYLKRDSAPVHC